MSSRKSIITLGTFDGVHLGHQKMIAELLAQAKKLDYEPILLTFFPHPTHILTPDKPLKMINSIDERVELLKKKGIQNVIVQEFTQSFANKSAYDFITDKLIGELAMKKLLVGYDHRFGKNKEGDFESLSRYAKELEFDMERLPALDVNGVTVSSSLIRQLLIDGKIEQVNALLGYHFCLFGSVVKGNQLGRKIGFNTANIVLDYPNKIVPKVGVYAVQSFIDGKHYYGMMNIGYRPTVQGTHRTIEVHYFNLNKDLYDKKIRVYVLKRLRDELKFANITALKEQLEKDKTNVLNYIKSL